MSDLYKNKYRSDTARATCWDYSQSGAYFITICTQNNEYFFGDVVKGEMVLSEIGEIAKSEWLKTFEMRQDMNLEMGEFVVMPNHVHGIIKIGENQYNSKRGRDVAYVCRDAMLCVPTDVANKSHNAPANNFRPQSKNLASIIRGFKIGVTKNARLIHAVFAWQSRFYDHIIRDTDEFDRITEYIIDNPEKWFYDKMNNKINKQNP